MCNILNDAACKEVSDIRLIYECSIKIPIEYSHESQLNTLTKETFHIFNNDISDKNFIKATTKLLADENYKLKVFEVVEASYPEDCIKFLLNEGLLVGIQGLSLIYQLEDIVPIRSWLCSFDRKNALYKDKENRVRFPAIYGKSNGGFSFCLNLYDNECMPGTRLICFS